MRQARRARAFQGQLRGFCPAALRQRDERQTVTLQDIGGNHIKKREAHEEVIKILEGFLQLHHHFSAQTLSLRENIYFLSPSLPPL